jgi:hypothetical protein
MTFNTWITSFISLAFMCIFSLIMPPRIGICVATSSAILIVGLLAYLVYKNLQILKNK